MDQAKFSSTKSPFHIQKNKNNIHQRFPPKYNRLRKNLRTKVCGVSCIIEGTAGSRYILHERLHTF
jgi:hypothetical protein